MISGRGARKPLTSTLPRNPRPLPPFFQSLEAGLGFSANAASRPLLRTTQQSKCLNSLCRQRRVNDTTMLIGSKPVSRFRCAARWRRMMCAACCWWLGLMAVWPRVAFGLPVELRAIGASVAALEEHPPEEAVDGLVIPGNGWSIKEGQSRKQSAVFATGKPLTATMCQLQFFFLSSMAHSHFAESLRWMSPRTSSPW